MLKFGFTKSLERKIRKLKTKDKILVQNFKRKFEEIINEDEFSIQRYKNLKSPQNEFKRIHLTDNFILLFKFLKKEKFVLFVDIVHRDRAYL